MNVHSASLLLGQEAVAREDLILTKLEPDDPLMLGRAYLCSPLTGGGASMGEALEALLRELPEQTVLQCSQIIARDHKAVEMYLRAKKTDHPLLAELVHKQAQVFEGMKSPGWSDTTPMLNQRYVIFTLSTPCKNSDPTQIDIDSALRHQQAFQSTLEQSFRHQVLSAAKIQSFQRLQFNPYEPVEEFELDPEVGLNEQAFPGNDVLDCTDYFGCIFNNDTWISGLAIQAYPKRPHTIFFGIMNMITGASFEGADVLDGGGKRVKGPVMFTTTITVEKQAGHIARTMSAINSRSPRAMAQKEKEVISLGFEDTPEVRRDLEYMKSRCIDGGDRFVRVSLDTFVYGKSKKETFAALSALRSVFSQLKFIVRDVTVNTGVRLSNCLLLNHSQQVAQRLNNDRLMPSSSASCLLPVYGDFTGFRGPDSEGFGFMTVTRRGQAHFFDPFSSNNPHGLLLGSSGVGKSVTAQQFERDMLVQGNRVIVLEVGASQAAYAQILSAIDPGQAQYNEFGGTAGKFRPNLLPFSGLSADEFDLYKQSITNIFTLMAYGEEKATGDAKIAIGEACAAAWAKKGAQASGQDVISALENVRSAAQAQGADGHIDKVTSEAIDIIPRLKAFFDSPARGGYFKGGTEFEVNARFIVNELKGIGDDPHLQLVVLFALFFKIKSAVERLPGRTIILMDECTDMLKVPAAGDATESFYRKGRKDGVAVWLSTQRPQDLLQSEAGRVAKALAAWRLLLKHENQDMAASLNVFSDIKEDPFLEKLFKSLIFRKGEFSELLTMGNGAYEVTRIYLDHYSLTVFNTEDKHRRHFFAEIKKGRAALEVIDEMAGESKRRAQDYVERFAESITQLGALDQKAIFNLLINKLRQ